MKRIFFVGALGASLASCTLPNSNAQTAAPANGQAVEPQGTRIEAELPKPPGQNRLISDAMASGGGGISSDVAWEPVFQAAIPEGNSFDVWVRHKYGPLVLKSVTGQEQRELIYLKANPSEWTWVNAGRFSKEQLGEKLLIIRGPQSEDPSPMLDCVVFSPTAGAPAPAQAANLSARRPAGTLVEAEFPKPPGRNSPVDAVDASGGQAVTSEVAWEPVFQAPIPATGEAFTLWLRHKGGPLILKSVQEDQQQDLKAISEAPSVWTWTNAGRYTRAQLKANLLIIRGLQGEGPLPLLDAVVFAPGEGPADAEPLKLGKVARVLPPEQADETLAPRTVGVKVDWAKRAGVMPAAMWGANDYEALTPAHAADATFQKQLGGLKLPWIRLHQGAISDAWTSSKTRDWDVPKIKAGLAASTGFGEARLMLNIASWPGWMQNPADGDILPEAKEDEFAALCARLVRVMRDEVKRPISYWEIINEKELAYSGANKLPDLWRLFNKVAVAIRREDPKARIGGPAFAWAKTEWVEDFLKNCGSNIQFISWHRYASNDIYESNESVLGKPEEMARTFKAIQGAVRKWVPERRLEILLTEYNIQAVWEPFERRHANSIGAVFNASVLRHMALAGLDGSAVWHLKGDAYGLIDAQNKPRPGYFLYRWGTKHLTGPIANASSGAKELEVLPVTGVNGKRALLLINKMPHRISVPGASALMGSHAGLYRSEIRGSTESSAVRIEKSNAASSLMLPGYSLTLLHN